jgi:type I restriction enzyme S subunit
VAAGTGATVQGVTLPFLKSLKIPLPPIEEQRRIVAMLDKALAAIATATANAKLNIANARDFSNAILSEVLSQGAGEWTTLGEATAIKVGFAFKSSGYSVSDEDIPLIRGDNVVQGRLRWDGIKRWPRQDLSAYEDYLLQTGDVLVAMDRTWVKAGLKYAVLSPNDVPSLLVQRVARLRASDVTSSDFIALQIASPEFTRYVLDIQTGLGVPHISGKQIADYRFRLPSPSKQTQIIEQLDNARRASNRLIELQQTKLLHLEQLKRSLLHIAFTPDLPKRDLLAA